MGKTYLCSIQVQVAALEEELRITDKLLAERNRLLEAIPPCPMHGSQCVPHALEWIHKKLSEECCERANPD